MENTLPENNGLFHSGERVDLPSAGEHFGGPSREIWDDPLKQFHYRFFVTQMNILVMTMRASRVTAAIATMPFESIPSKGFSRTTSSL